MGPPPVLLGNLLMVRDRLLRPFVIRSSIGERKHGSCVEGGLLLLHWEFEGKGHA